ncbi:DUF4347 domain-containing protein [Massilia aurea]|uniref:Ig-like domain-containing protein n=1 Tax=Massilia aurea TaxID=373040 RepID=UPI0034636ACA
MPAQTTASRQEIAFVNSNLADIPALIAGLRADIEVIMLDPTRDGVEQIAEALAGRAGLDAIHLVGHGASGLLQLGDVTLDAAYLKSHPALMAQIGASLDDDGDILVYGCETGAGRSGGQFLQALAATTGADTAASTDVSGGALAGGNWQLERSAGQVDTVSAMTLAADNYLSMLPLSTGTIHTYSENTWAWSSLVEAADGTLYLAHKIDRTAVSIETWNGAGWTEVTRVTTSMTGDTEFGDYLNLQIDPDGNLDLMFQHSRWTGNDSVASTRGIKFGEYNLGSNSWTTSTVQEASHPSGARNFSDPSLTVTADGALHVVYNYAYSPGGSAEYKIQYASSSNNGQTWSVSTVLTTTINGEDELHNPTVLLDNDGAIHLFYVREDNQNVTFGNLYHAVKTAGSNSWSTPEKIASDLGSNFTVATDGEAFYFGYSDYQYDAQMDITGTTLKVLSNESGNWVTDSSQSYTGLVGVSGLEVSAGKLHMLVSGYTQGYAESFVTVLRKDGATWTKGFQGEQDLPSLTVQAPDIFDESTFLIGADGQIMVVTESGELKVVGYTTGSAADFGLDTNAAPVVSDLAGDSGVFTAGAPDPVEDMAYIDEQAGNMGAVVVSDADGGDFIGGNLTITRTSGAADGRFVFDFDSSGLLAFGPDSNSLGGTLRAGDKLFHQELGTWTEIGQVHATKDGQAGRDLVITFTGVNADATAASDLIKFMLYTAPSAGARAFSLTVSDGDGGTSAPVSFGMTGIDIVAPVVSSITSSAPDGLRKLGDTVQIAVKFSEAVIVTGAPTLLLETGATDRAATYLNGSGSDTLVFSYTVQAGDLSADLDVVSSSALQLNGGTLRDAGGNNAVLTLAAPGAAGSLGAAKAIAVDGAAPSDIVLSNATVATQGGAHAPVGTLSSVDANPLDSFTYSLVSGAGSTNNSAFEIVGAQLRALDAGTLSPGAYLVRVRTQDAAGNRYEESMSINVTSGPSVAITTDRASLGVGQNAMITFTFSDTPQNFVLGDVTVAGGTLGSLTVNPLNDKVYTATFTPTAGQQSLAASISVGANTFTDAGGLQNTASTTNAILSGDTLAPSVTISSDRATFKAGETATVTFTFSEPPSNFVASDIAVTGGALGNLQASANPLVYTATFTPTANLESLSGKIAIAAAAYTDAYGNDGAAATDLTIVGDTLAPVVSGAGITLSGASGVGGVFVAGDTARVKWDDSADGDHNPDTAAVSVDMRAFGGPAAVAATRVDGVWSASFAITAGAIDASGRNVAVTVVDDDGNQTIRNSSSTASIDNQAPTVTAGAIAVAGANGAGGVYKIGDVVSATWSTAINVNADVAGVQFDFSGFGGGLVAGSANNGIWSATYTIVAANLDAANRNVAVAVTDDAGNLTSLAGIANVRVDAIHPQVTSITVAGNPAPDATSIDYTVVFSEVVQGVELEDFILVGEGEAEGTLAGLSGAGTNWTVSVNGISGSGTLTLIVDPAVAGIRDTVGNTALEGVVESDAHGVSFNGVPVIGSNGGGASAQFSVAEKQQAVTTVTATDADQQPLTYAISGGADAALFTIDAATGVLRFLSAPLRSQAADSDLDHVYEVSVSAQDGQGGIDTQALSVTVLADLDGDGMPDLDDDDIDNDGGLNSVEDPVPGALGVVGDGNGDGLADSTQRNVASLPTVVPGAPYATLEVENGLSLSSVSSLAAASGLPRNVKMPVGQFDFTIDNVAPGAAATVSIYVDSSLKVNGYYKQNTSGAWVNLATAVTAVGTKTKVTFSLTDGGQFDSDGVVNGSISDPGGLVTIAPAIVSNGGAPTANLTVREGTTTVTTVQAGSGAGYAITGGLDAALFQIDAVTGALRFASTPSHSQPLDAGADNVYDVQVTATDAFGFDTQALAVRVTARPTTPVTPTEPPVTPPATVIDGVSVVNETRTNADGSTSTAILIPVVQPDRAETVGNNTVADIPLVSVGGRVVLSTQVPQGVGVTISGTAAPVGVNDALTNLIREIRGVTTDGSFDQTEMTGGGSGFLASLPTNANLLVHTVAPTAAPGALANGQLVIQGVPAGTGQPLSALVIDTKGLPGGSTISLQDVSFAAIVGSVTVRGGAGSQTVWGDSASQNIMLGDDDDVLHGGGGDDIVGSGGGNDRIFGDDGNDIVFGGLGNDFVDGGAGIDRVQLVGSGRDDYSARFDNGQLVLTHRDGGADGVDTVANVEVLRFTDADADTSVRGTVERLYEAVRGGAADQATLGAMADAAAQGVSLVEIAGRVLASGEAQQAAGSDAAFLTALYANTFGRAIDASGLAYWSGALGGGQMSRAEVALSIVDSAEKLAMPVTRDIDVGATDIGTLVRLYSALFDRSPDMGGINYWLSLSEADMSLADIADGFIASAEASAGYSAMSNEVFTQSLYGSAMHRTASAAEVAYWTGLLDSGALDRGDVLLQFAESDEKVALVGVISTSLDTGVVG